MNDGSTLEILDEGVRTLHQTPLDLGSRRGPETPKEKHLLHVLVTKVNTIGGSIINGIQQSG